jgi:hypothetical protein
MITVTLADLRGQNKLPRACNKFSKYFEQHIGESTAPMEWNQVAQGLMLGDPFWRQGWGWAVANGYIPAWSMRGADLSRANLSGADLSGANLRRIRWNDLTTWPSEFELLPYLSDCG